MRESGTKFYFRAWFMGLASNGQKIATVKLLKKGRYELHIIAHLSISQLISPKSFLVLLVEKFLPSTAVPAVDQLARRRKVCEPDAEKTEIPLTSELEVLNQKPRKFLEPCKARRIFRFWSSDSKSSEALQKICTQSTGQFEATLQAVQIKKSSATLTGSSFTLI